MSVKKTAIIIQVHKKKKKRGGDHDEDEEAGDGASHACWRDWAAVARFFGSKSSMGTRKL